MGRVPAQRREKSIPLRPPRPGWLWPVGRSNSLREPTASANAASANLQPLEAKAQQGAGSAADARERAERARPQGRDAAGTSESLGPTEVLPAVGPFQVGDTASGVRQMSYDRAWRAAGTGLRFTARSRSGLGTRVPRDASSLGPHLPCSEIQLAPLRKSPRARIRKGELF